jgi:hypothetical protein
MLAVKVRPEFVKEGVSEILRTWVWRLTVPGLRREARPWERD